MRQECMDVTHDERKGVSQASLSYVPDAQLTFQAS